MRTPKKSFCFAPQYNSPQKGHPLGTDGKELLRHDATGAFHPYMNAFKKLYSQDGGEVATLKFDNHGTAEHIFKQVVQGIWYGPTGLDAVAYFGHGGPNSLASAHIGAKAMPEFAAAVRANCKPGVIIALYACSCGRVSQPGGCFASKLAAELIDMQAVVFGHNDPGHTTTNPHLYRYEGSKPGMAVAPPGMEKAFNRLLKAESIDKKPKGNTAFWARVPFMTETEIRAELGG